MKKILSVILTMVLLFTVVAACVAEPAPPPAPEPGAADPAPAPVDPDPADPAPAPDPQPPAEPVVDEPFPGKIAIITNTVDQNEEEFRSAEALQLKYGTDKIIHRTWPVNFSVEGEMMISIVREIASDPEVGAVIINQAVINTNAAVDTLRELRGDDVFVVYASPAEDPADVAARADLLFDVNNPLVGERYVMQAIALGADTIAHYSFPRHMSVPLLAMRRDIMKDVSEREGINFVELVAPDPTADGGQAATQMHIMQDLPRQVATLGVNTSFFGTNCAMQIPLITQVLETGAIYAQPCCPSPYHGFPTALGITDKLPTGEYNPETGEEIMRLRDLSEVVDATRAAIAARGLSGRLSTWPVPASMMWTTIGVEYAIKWLNGQVPQQPGVIDLDVLSDLAAAYIMDIVGEPIGVDFVTYDVAGQRLDHFVLGIVDFLTY